MLTQDVQTSSSNAETGVFDPQMPAFGAAGADPMLRSIPNVPHSTTAVAPPPTALNAGSQAQHTADSVPSVTPKGSARPSQAIQDAAALQAPKTVEKGLATPKASKSEDVGKSGSSFSSPVPFRINKESKGAGLPSPHTSASNPPEAHTCWRDDCDAVEDSLHMLNVHFTAAHTRAPLLFCPLCRSEDKMGFSQYVRHWRSNHSDRGDVPCFHCILEERSNGWSSTYSTIKSVQEHYEAEHAHKQYICMTCGKDWGKDFNAYKGCLSACLRRRSFRPPKPQKLLKPN